jgi:type II secretory pathway component PulF
MVRAGEAGGFLDVVLAQIADFQARERDLGGRIKNALAYPAVLAVVATGVMVVMLTYFIPKFSTMFEDMGGSLPALTRWIVAASDLLIHRGLYLLAGLIVAIMLIRRGIKSPGGRMRVERLMLRMPGIGLVVSRLALVRFSRMLGTLLAAGVPLVASLRVAAEALGNQVLSQAMHTAIEDVVRGRSLARSLQGCGQLFPLSVTETLAVAEEAGRLDKELIRLAGVYEFELDRQLRLMVALAEPAMLFVMAGLVGTIVIGMLLPIFSMQELIK